MQAVKWLVAIAVLSLAPALANAAPKPIVLAADQQPSAVQEGIEPIQPFYQTVLPHTFEDDANNTGG